MTTCTQTDEITPASTSSAQTPPSSVEIADIMEGHIKFASEDALAKHLGKLKGRQISWRGSIQSFLELETLWAY